MGQHNDNLTGSEDNAEGTLGKVYSFKNAKLQKQENHLTRLNDLEIYKVVRDMYHTCWIEGISPEDTLERLSRGDGLQLICSATKMRPSELTDLYITFKSFFE